MVGAALVVTAIGCETRIRVSRRARRGGFADAARKAHTTMVAQRVLALPIATAANSACATVTMFSASLAGPNDAWEEWSRAHPAVSVRIRCRINGALTAAKRFAFVTGQQSCWRRAGERCQGEENDASIAALVIRHLCLFVRRRHAFFSTARRLLSEREQGRGRRAPCAHCLRSNGLIRFQDLLTRAPRAVRRSVVIVS